MASYEYAVTIQATGHGEIEIAGDWTHNSATAYAHTFGGAPGTTIRVYRWRTGPGRLPRQGHGERHRAYVVQANGIVRRTDRTSQKA